MNTASRSLGRFRRAADVLLGRATVATQPPSYADMGDAFDRSYQMAKAYTMTSRERMFALWQAVHHVSRASVPGDVVECGVWRGGSAMMAALGLLNAQETRALWLYDTFEGMPAPTDRDVRFDGTTAEDSLAKLARRAGAFNDWAYATLADVQSQMAATKYPQDILHFIQGPVEQTIPDDCPPSIAVLRLDTDWYASTRHELENLWPRLSPGGVLIVDDYGHWQGAREAVDEFFTTQEIAILLHRVDYTGRIAIKPGA